MRSIAVFLCFLISALFSSCGTANMPTDNKEKAVEKKDETVDHKNITLSDALNKEEWIWAPETDNPGHTADWYYGQEWYWEFWTDPGGVRRMALILPPYVIHKESIKSFARKVKNSRVVKNSLYEQTLYLKYSGKEPDKKVILDIKRRGVLVIRQGSRNVECYCYTKDKGFNKVIYIDLGKRTEKERMALNAEKISKIVSAQLEQTPRIHDFGHPNSELVKNDYYNKEFWNAHDLKFIIQIFSFYREARAAGFEPSLKNYKKHKNGEEEIFIASDGTYPDRRFVLDRKRQRYLVFIERDAVSPIQIRFVRRINGAIREDEELCWIENEELFYTLSSQEVSEMMIVK